MMDHYKLFKGQVDVLDVHGGCFGYHPGLSQKKLVKMKADMMLSPGSIGYDDALVALTRKASDAQCKEYWSSLFLRIADSDCFSNLKDQFDNLHLLDGDKYPKRMESALRFLQNYKGNSGKSRGKTYNSLQHRQAQEGVAFPQVGSQSTGGRG